MSLARLPIAFASSLAWTLNSATGLLALAFEEVAVTARRLELVDSSRLEPRTVRPKATLRLW